MPVDVPPLLADNAACFSVQSGSAWTVASGCASTSVPVCPSLSLCVSTSLSEPMYSETGSQPGHHRSFQTPTSTSHTSHTTNLPSSVGHQTPTKLKTCQ